ncbi:MAG: TonB-dependent receptor plug domain-containing protein [Prevotellaceae bacterium]|jgi:hypothetical protein|nr:TonB-dependent receptor plug domain-containing protein [Prevotellaceae bacterium]
MKHIVFFVFALLFAAGVKAQSIHPLEEKLGKQLKSFPQEKIYLHTDKSTYVSGEKVWYRAYLVDAILHAPAVLSRYIYVELVSPAGESVSRDKIRPSADSAFHNSISLPDDLAEGTYLIRACTNFMRNREDYFFEKKIFVADPQSFMYQISTDFVFENKNVKFKLNVSDYDNKPINVENLSIRIDTGKMKKFDINDGYSFKKTSDKTQTVYVEFERNGRKFKKYMPVPDDDFDVSFFPEGGSLISDIHCRIGFKALKSSGVSEDSISGEIFDGNNSSIGVFKSVHAGMGAFYFYPEHGKNYFAECKTQDGKTKRYKLPASQSDACALKVTQNKSKMYINVLKGKDFRDRTLNLLVHLRGIPVYSGEIENIISIDKSTLPSGVIQILLVDSDMNTLSERLYFNLNSIEIPKTELTPDKTDYGKREHAAVKIAVTDREGNPLDGNVSVSVTDNRDVLPDSLFTITSSLLLSSEIRGYVESPAHYLKIPSDADYLMLTQGWRRYSMPAVFKDSIEKPVHYLEAGQEISGTVKRVLGSKVNENNSVSVFSPAGYFDMTLSDENGRFSFNGFEFPDSTMFVVQALNKRGGKYVELLVDPETAPPVKPFVVSEFEYDSLFKNYVEKADLKYSDEFGMRVTTLEEIVITGHKDEPLTHKTSMYSSSFNTVVKADAFKNATDLSRALMEIPGVFVSGNKVSIRGSSIAPQFIIDDIIWDDFDLNSVNIRDVERIEVMKDAQAAVLGSRGAGGAIIIYTKTGTVNNKNVPQFNVKTLFPKGYKKDVEFYSPKYDVPFAGIDRRTTIYWNPNIVLKSGDGEFDFYTADASTSYTVTVEGLTKDGRIVRATKNISRRK